MGAKKKQQQQQKASKRSSFPASLKKLWVKYVAAIDAGLKRGSWVEIWEAALEIVERKLYVAGGHANAAAFFRDQMSVDPAIAERNIRIVKHASLDDEQTYGADVLDATLAYLEARHGKIRGRLPVALERIRVPVLRFGEEELVPISDATALDIVLARKKLTSKT